MKYGLLALASIFLWIAGWAVHAATTQNDKIDNEVADMKSAFKQAGTSGNVEDLPDLAGAKIAGLDPDAVKTDAVMNDPFLEGDFVQGGLAVGTTIPGASVRLNNTPVPVSDTGRFIIGFGRDHVATAKLTVTFADGSSSKRVLEIAPRDFPVQSITIPDQSKVSGFTEEQLVKIRAGTAKKKTARQTGNAQADWTKGFQWPFENRERPNYRRVRITKNFKWRA